MSLGLLAVSERRKLHSALQSEAAILHRLASQRADQHDAHLTSLSALAIAGQDDLRNLFLEIASTIQRFYPRIEAVDLVPLDNMNGYISSRQGLTDEVVHVSREAALASNGQLMLFPVPDTPGRYLVVKRSPNSDNARYGLALQVNAHGLLDTESEFWAEPFVSRTLRMPDGTLLITEKEPVQDQLEKTLGSASQP